MLEESVFLSAVSSEFESTDSRWPRMRTKLADQIELVGPRPYLQERLRQVPVDTLEKLAGYISKSATVVHIVGRHPGWVAEDLAVTRFLVAYPNFLGNYPSLRNKLGSYRGIPYTQWEALLALHMGKPLFVYRTIDAKTNPLQKSHLERIEKHAGRYAETFKTPIDLYPLILTHLYGERWDRLRDSRRKSKIQMIFGLLCLSLLSFLAIAPIYSGERLQSLFHRWKSEKEVTEQEEKKLAQRNLEEENRKRLADAQERAEVERKQIEREKLQAERQVQVLAKIENKNQEVLDELLRVQEARKKREEESEQAAANAAKNRTEFEGLEENEEGNQKLRPVPFAPPRGFTLCVFRTDGNSITIDNGNQIPSIRRYYPRSGLGTNSRILPTGAIEAGTVYDGIGIISKSSKPPQDLLVTVTLDGIEAPLTPASDLIAGSGGLYKHSYMAGALPAQGKPILKAYVKSK